MFILRRIYPNLFLLQDMYLLFFDEVILVGL